MSPPKPTPALTLQGAVLEMQADAYERFMANERRRTEILRRNAPQAVQLATVALEAIRELRALEAAMCVDGLAPTFGDGLEHAAHTMGVVRMNAADVAAGI